MPEIFLTHSEQETFSVAETLGRTLKPGMCILLSGDLGSGKTAFVRGLASGLGIDPDEVTSPTFVIVQHYQGATPLVHVDLYRLETAAAVDDLGLEELGAESVLAIEWAERLAQRLPESISVKITDGGGDRRTISVER